MLTLRARRCPSRGGGDDDDDDGDDDDDDDDDDDVDLAGSDVSIERRRCRRSSFTIFGL